MNNLLVFLTVFILSGCTMSVVVNDTHGKSDLVEEETEATSAVPTVDLDMPNL